MKDSFSEADIKSVALGLLSNPSAAVKKEVPVVVSDVKPITAEVKSVVTPVLSEAKNLESDISKNITSESKNVVTDVKKEVPVLEKTVVGEVDNELNLFQSWFLKRLHIWAPIAGCVSVATVFAAVHLGGVGAVISPLAGGGLVGLGLRLLMLGLLSLRRRSSKTFTFEYYWDRLSIISFAF